MLRSIDKGKTTWRYTPLVYCLVLTAALALMIVASRTTFGLGSNQQYGAVSLLIRLSVAIPELIVWAIALACAIRFKQYALTIKRSRDGASLDYLANGLLWLVAYVIALSLGERL